MKIYVVHVYDAADKLHDYYVHGTIEIATNRAATDVVAGRFKDAEPAFYWEEVSRVVRAVQIEPGTGRRQISCDSWRAHIEEMKVGA